MILSLEQYLSILNSKYINQINTLRFLIFIYFSKINYFIWNNIFHYANIDYINISYNLSIPITYIYLIGQTQKLLLVSINIIHIHLRTIIFSVRYSVEIYNSNLNVE